MIFYLVAKNTLSGFIENIKVFFGSKEYIRMQSTMELLFRRPYN
jgi:hypothetical protein